MPANCKSALNPLTLAGKVISQTGDAFPSMFHEGESIMSPEMVTRFNIELSLSNLMMELMNLLTLERKLEDSDKQILQDCSIKLNQLLLNKVL